MPKTKLIATWIELGEGFIHNSPPRQSDWDAMLFINTVEVRENAKGHRYLLRSTGIETLRASSQEMMRQRIEAFALREDVRRLIKGVEANDFDALPQRVESPSEEIMNGTDAIYFVEEEPAST